MMVKRSRIYVAGASGLVGSAVVRKLREQGYERILTPTHKQLDLLDYGAVLDFFVRKHPDYVFLCAAKAGGIISNSKYPADFIYENIQIQTNIIKAAHECQTPKLLFLGSSCIYPKLAPQPLKEEYLMTGALEYTNEAYAVAKIAGIMMCKKYKEQYGDNFIAAMPCNLYGPNDNFDPETSHVIPALINKIRKATKKGDVTLWGSGKPLREFLYVDDLAEGLIFLMNNYDGLDFINIGSGEEISIMELANTISRVMGFEGRFMLDKTKPDGTPRKVLDVSKLRQMGWEAKVPLEEGLKETIKWYLTNKRK